LTARPKPHVSSFGRWNDSKRPQSRRCWWSAILRSVGTGT
jgi:hypothetical protein